MLEQYNDIGTSDQFIGNFLAQQGDLEHIVKNKVWLISDTHFHHRNILKYEAEFRPFKDRDEMDEVLIQRWNELVGPYDVVFHLGDFALAGKTITRNIISRLNGRKFLLLGNHDLDSGFRFDELGFEKVYDRPIVLDKRFVLSHEPLDEIPPGFINIYGHVHSKGAETFLPDRFCVCVERHGCRPVEWNYIRGLYENGD